ncbi:MAG TPA: hypothetical protein VG248_09385 [Caulobacteraceae bacterium]|jgi:hypothetical protein|nr:hypothetical protein [Caulobacteraceae bacterium]
MARFVKVDTDLGDVFVNPANVTKVEEVKGAPYCYIRFVCADQFVRANAGARAVADLIGDALDQSSTPRVVRFG